MGADCLYSDSYVSLFFSTFIITTNHLVIIIMALSRKSEWMVDNVYQGFKRVNAYDSITKYNEGSSTACIRWEKNGSIYRIYKFHANFLGTITSMTIHGVNPQGEYNAMSRSRVAFGLPVNKLEMKRDSSGDYVEVIFGSY